MPFTLFYIAGFPNPHGSPFNTGDIFSVKALKVGFCQSPEDYKYITIASTPVSVKKPRPAGERLFQRNYRPADKTVRVGWKEAGLSVNELLPSEQILVDLMVVADGVKMTH